MRDFRPKYKSEVTALFVTLGGQFGYYTDNCSRTGVPTMGSGERRTTANQGDGDDQLAKDVARLYAWANVQGVPYRDFSRPRPAHHKQPAPPIEDQKAEITSVAEKIAIESAPVPGTVSQKFVLLSDEGPPPERASVPGVGIRAPETSNNAQAARPVPQPPLNTPFQAPLMGIRPRPRPRYFERTSEDSERGRPALAVLSLAGGVGKTTLCANLARILCFRGEDVLLVDASGSGLLPFYFGANDLRPGLRTFVAPGMQSSQLRVIGAEEVTASWIEKDVRPAMATSQRTIFDLGPASFSLLPQILALCSAILIPVMPDLNSILSISRIESLLEKLRSTGTQIPSPFYLFNQFVDDYSMDHEARELARRHCGERLLPISVRHGAEVAESIACRMTVADYAPASEVARDFLELALWLERTAPVQQQRSAVRWTEQ